MEEVVEISKAERTRLLKQAGAVAPTNAEFKELAHSAGNWVYLHGAMSKLNSDEEGMLRIRKYLHMELTRGDPRPFIIERLHNRLTAMRRDVERAAIRELVPSMPEEQ